METDNYIGELNELAMKRKWLLKFEDVRDEGPCHFKTFVQRAVVNGEVYPDGMGSNKKEARQKAAKNALTCLKEKCDQADSTAAGNFSQPSRHQMEEVNQNVSAVCKMAEKMAVKPKESRDYTGLINKYCQKKNCFHNFIEVDRRRGPSHDFVFFCKVVIKNIDYPVAQGATIKEARQNAAALAWYALQEQSDWDSKMSLRSTVSEGGASARRSTGRTSLDYVRASAQVNPVTSTDSAIIVDSPNNDEGPKFENVGDCQSTPSTQSRFTSTYESIELLGKGGFGSVYKARHKLMDKDYAVKIVRGKEKALREVKALSDLHHRNILRYYTCWLEDTLYQMDDEDDDSYSSYSCSTASSQTNSSAQYLYIEMELCDIKTLKKWIHEMNEKTVSDLKRRAESLKIAQQIATGVEYIHSKMLIHRDLKPDNILFGLDEQVKIGDFGLVTDDGGEDEVNLLLRTDNVGTTSYMAPEQKSEMKYDRKVDIFALGLIYFELLWPFSTVTEKAKIWDHVRSQDLPQEFSVMFPEENQLIVSMLRKRPEKRPEARKVKEQLQDWARTFDTKNQGNRTV